MRAPPAASSPQMQGICSALDDLGAVLVIVTTMMMVIVIEAARGSANPDSNSRRDPGVKPIWPVWSRHGADRLRVVRVARFRSVKTRRHWLFAFPDRGKAA